MKMRIMTGLSATISLILLLILEACGPTGAPTETGQANLTIVSPADGGEIPGNEVKLVVQTTGHSIVQTTSSAKKAGEGHIHIYIDGSSLPTMAYETTFTLTGLPNGKHILDVELVNNDHSPLSPPVRKSVHFSVTGAKAGEAPQPPSQPDYGY